MPDWPAPPDVHACVTTRFGPGISAAPFDRFNLGSRCGDAMSAVAANRATLVDVLALPEPPVWLHQVHGIQVFEANNTANASIAEVQADAAITRQRGRVLAVLTADCLPLLVAAADGSEIAAVHAGWRGLCAGVIEACISRLHTSRENLLVWLGPAISATSYEVGDEVRNAFIVQNALAREAFISTRPGHWRCDLYMLARQRLAAMDIRHVYGGNFDIFTDTRFYSYRRDGMTGRFASLIWITL